MAFDTPTRNRLARFVSDARKLVAEEFTQQFQSLYGISADGVLTPLDQLKHLEEEGLATAQLLRARIDYLVRTHPEERDGMAMAVDRLARELAFTVLNRMAALRMAEQRGLIQESVGGGYTSKGYKLYESVAGTGLGDTYHRYRRYLFCLFDELAVDLGSLFDRSSPTGLLFPREAALEKLLALLNAHELEALWAEDETIGWVYQYYNDPDERKNMRKASGAPRNSRELAVRNQFFTPRYVVEFLTDNTLGRIWYEMMQGRTALAERCRYLVRMPTEIFLKEGQAAPEQKHDPELKLEEQLKLPVHIKYRAPKDPRELRFLDPACGSMHFGLYATDLFMEIYAEAWTNEVGTLRQDYPTLEALQREVPRLIIEHNIHGIDIDPRAAQIANLALWLRAQRTWHEQGVPAGQRPRIKRSNVVCAEPMPGDHDQLVQFVEESFSEPERPIFRYLLEQVVLEMQLAGEAGYLLPIEKHIRHSVEKTAALVKKAQADLKLFGASEMRSVARGGAPNALNEAAESLAEALEHKPRSFFETLEKRIYAALAAYADVAAETGGYQRRLFAEDAAKGFALIDLCNQQYDVVVMNPPFGEFSKGYKAEARTAYPYSYNDILAAFVDRAGQLLHPGGRIGAITSRTCFFLSSYTKWREKVVLGMLKPELLVDLGHGVMDAAMVEAAAYVLAKEAT
jgi:hypothetical protein